MASDDYMLGLKDFSDMALGVFNGDPNAKTNFILKQCDRLMDIRNKINDLMDEVEPISRKKNIIKVQPNETIFGYRWTINQSDNQIYIVKIVIENEYWRDTQCVNLLDFVAEDFSIVDMWQIETGEHIDVIDKHNAYFDDGRPFEVGGNYHGKIWFCLSYNDLIASQGGLINAKAKKELVKHIRE